MAEQNEQHEEHEGQGQEGQEHEADEQQYEEEARRLGWVPKDEYRDKDRWIDAKTFVERGKQILPILRRENQRLEAELRSLRARDSERDSELRSVKASLKAIEAAQDQDLQSRAEDLIEDLEGEIEAATEAGDSKKVAKLTRQLVELQVAQSTSKGRGKAKGAESEEEGEGLPARKAGEVHPDYAAFIADKPWLGTDVRRSALLEAAALTVAHERPELRGKGRLFYDEVEKEFAKMEGRGARKREGSRVEGGGPGPRSGGGGGSDYEDLPPDARRQCDADAKRFVGAGKEFKDVKAWRKFYAREYFGQGAEA